MPEEHRREDHPVQREYVLAFKGNQGKLHRVVVDYVTEHLENDFRDIEVRKHVERAKGHDRTDEITYYQLAVPKDLAAKNDWRWLKRFAISLLKQVDDKESVAMRRRMAGWNPSYPAKVLGIPA